MILKARPEWTRDFPAIDGIQKPVDTYMDDDPNGGRSEYVRKPEEEAIRSDVIEILNMDSCQFSIWIKRRRYAILQLLEHYELFASIPHLGYGAEKSRYTMCAITHVGNHLASLKHALKYLDKIEEVYHEED